MESQRTHRRKPRLRLATGVLAALGCGLALGGGGPAQAQVSIVREDTPRLEWRGHVASDFRSEFETKSDAGDEFHTWRTGVEGEFGGPINESVLVGFATRYAYTGFDFNLDGGLEKKLRHLKVHLIGVGGADARTYTRRGYFDAMKTQIDHGIFDYCGACVVTSELLLDSETQDPAIHLDRARTIGSRLFEASLQCGMQAA